MRNESRRLGLVATKGCDEINSSLAPFRVLHGYRTVYPSAVVHALGELYMDYNRAFWPLVEANREWGEDYQYCLADGSTVNWAVQIDMVGLTDGFLKEAADMPGETVRAALRGKVFEFENSLAMYQLLERICARPGRSSFFQPRFRAVLDALRGRYEMPIALLAVTDQKCNAMLQSEFGKQEGETISDEEVRQLSGFDRFFGPKQFREHVTANGGKCRYLLFARTSDPVAKLKKPDVVIDHPLLGDPEMRRIIKANAVTFNVDAPEWPVGDRRRINDTKEYMGSLNMAFHIEQEVDLLASPFAAYLSRSKPHQPSFEGPRLAAGFAKYLKEHGVDPEAVGAGKVALRCKPLKGAYGCYGHVSGVLTDGQFRGELRRNLRMRGRYVVQPEMTTPNIVNSDEGVQYTYIDRNFMGVVNGYPVFLGGFRSLMPVDTTEAMKGRVHGNGHTVWAEIVSDE